MTYICPLIYHSGRISKFFDQKLVGKLTFILKWKTCLRNSTRGPRLAGNSPALDLCFWDTYNFKFKSSNFRLQRSQNICEQVLSFPTDRSQTHGVPSVDYNFFFHTIYIWPYLTFYPRTPMSFLSALQSLTTSVELHLSLLELCFPLYLFSSLPTSLNQNIHTSHTSLLSKHLLYIHGKTSVQLSNSNLYILVGYKRRRALILPLRITY